MDLRIFVYFVAIFLFLLPSLISNNASPVQNVYYTKTLNKGIFKNLLVYSADMPLADCKCKDGYCENVNGKYVCKCKPGWGLVPGNIFTEQFCKKCDCGKTFNCTFTRSPFGIVSGPICQCPDGYGEIKAKCKGNCKKNPCRNGGRCIVKGEDIVCQCKALYEGELCEKNKCSHINCLNNGKCDVKDGKPVCICTDRFIGDKCEVDKCLDVECQNNGTCDVRDGKPFCNCTDGFTGERCDEDSLGYVSTTVTNELFTDPHNVTFSTAEVKTLSSEVSMETELHSTTITITEKIPTENPGEKDITTSSDIITEQISSSTVYPKTTTEFQPITTQTVTAADTSTTKGTRQSTTILTTTNSTENLASTEKVTENIKFYITITLEDMSTTPSYETSTVPDKITFNVTEMRTSSTEVSTKTVEQTTTTPDAENIPTINPGAKDIKANLELRGVFVLLAILAILLIVLVILVILFNACMQYQIIHLLRKR